MDFKSNVSITIYIVINMSVYIVINNDKEVEVSESNNKDSE